MSNVIKLNGYDVRDPHGVHFDSADGLTDAQQAQARENIGAASDVGVVSALAQASDYYAYSASPQALGYDRAEHTQFELGLINSSGQPEASNVNMRSLRYIKVSDADKATALVSLSGTYATYSYLVVAYDSSYNFVARTSAKSEDKLLSALFSSTNLAALQYIKLVVRRGDMAALSNNEIEAFGTNAKVYLGEYDTTAEIMSDVTDLVDLRSDAITGMLGANMFILPEVNINNSGVLEYSKLWNVLCIKASAGYMINSIKIGASSDRMCYAFYADTPALNSAAVNERRYLSGAGTITASNVVMIDGASWIAVRYAPGDFPVVDCPSATLNAALLGGVQDLPDSYGHVSLKGGVLTDAANDAVLSVNDTYLNSGDVVRISNKNMFEFQQTWSDISRQNVRFIVDRDAGSITVKTTGSPQEGDITSQNADSSDHIVIGQNGRNLHCLFSFKFQADTVVSIAGNPAEPFSYRDSCQLQVTDGSNDASHTIYDRGNGITMVARAGVDYGVRIAITITEKTGSFESEDGITFYPQVEIGPKVTPYVLHQGMDVEYTGTDIAAQLRTYAPVTTVVVESASNGGIIINYRKATLAQKAVDANAAAQKLATLAELHKYSKYAPAVTFIDDDTTRIDSVERYHDIMEELGVVGNYACIATNIEESEGMAELLQSYENEGYGMLFHCDLQRGTETEYFLPDSRRDIGKCRKNVLDGLRKMPGFGLNNYKHWVTPYGVNDKDIQDIARQAGLDCIITTDTQTIVGNNANAERYNLPRLSMTMNVNANRTIRRIKAAVDAAKATSGWVLITTHAYEWPETLDVITDDGESTETVTPEQLMTKLISYIKQQGVEIVSFQTAWERRKQMFYLNEAFGNL